MAGIRFRAAFLIVAAFAAVVASGASSGSTVSGSCSRPTAVQLAKQFHLGFATLPNPVASVLCAAFTGPGSKAMVVTFASGGSIPVQGWAVFRQVAGAWQLALNQPVGGFEVLTAAGSDIRETDPNFRKGDPLCCASGGTKTRIWHWNGTSFTASAWTQGAPPKSGPTTVWVGLNFQSPSGNILCDQGDEDMVTCASFVLPHSVSLRGDGTVRICNGRKCLGPNPGTKANPNVPVLAYGRQNQRIKDGWLCRSETTGITCTVRPPGKAYRQGFLINSAGVTRVGP